MGGLGVVKVDARVEKDLREQVVPKLGLTLQEVEFALGSVSLVRELREAGVLVSSGRRRKAELFDAGVVARVWAEFREGKYDGKLENWRSALL